MVSRLVIVCIAYINRICDISLEWYLATKTSNPLFGTPTDAHYMQKCKPKSHSPPKDKSDYTITHVSVAITPNPQPQTLNPKPKLSKSFTRCKYNVLDALTLKTKPNGNKTKRERGSPSSNKRNDIRCFCLGAPAELGLLVVDG